MRSRNGNRPFLLSSLTLISSLTLWGEDYYIGYRFAAKDTLAFHETLSVAKAMRPCTSLKNPPTLTLKRLPNESLEKLLSREPSEFLAFASDNEVRIKSNQASHSAALFTLDSLTYPTRCYAVEFNDEFVTITPTE